jgi:signal transduction histidine kinase
VLLAGEVSVYRHDGAGRRVALRQFQDGDYFGEVALLDSKPRTATVASLTECRLFVLDQSAFRKLLTSDPPLFLSVLGAVADRVRDQVEDHYRAELENLRLEAQAEIERHRSLAQMVAGVAHELNTPLGITNTAVDMIANRLARAEVVTLFENGGTTRAVFENICEATSLAQRNIARAHQLIQDFKKVSVDQFVDSPQLEDLAELVAASIDLFQINARRANLTIEVDDRLPPTSRSWFGYPGHLTQVVLNLLTNIETYAYEPGTGGRVDIVLSATDVPPVPTFTITVRDHGHGIPVEHRERVFEPFFTTGRGVGGTGLGLAIVRNIVSGPLKGEITLDPISGRGAMFRITFPQEVTSVQHQLADLDR